MAFTTRAKEAFNRAIEPLNLRLETLTARRVEDARLRALEAGGHFSRPVFPVPPAFQAADPAPVLAALARYAGEIAALTTSDGNAGGFTLDNHYYTSPDAEVCYCVIRESAPARIVEVGSGNSTRLARAAICDGDLQTTLVSIDPNPRLEVTAIADVVCAKPAESSEGRAHLAALRPGDILFIDSSHEIRPGNDVIALYLEVLPALPSGVLIQIDDIFLPCDYPAWWVVEERWPFTEQDLLQGMLMSTDRYEVLWPGRYLQRTLPSFASHFPHLAGRTAKSVWLRVR